VNVARAFSLTLGLALLGALLTVSCASYRYTRKAEDATRIENWDAAVYYYLEALASDPGNVSFKMGLKRARLKAGEEHFRRGMRFKDANDLQRAQSELELAVQLDATHQYAEVELSKVRRDLAILAEQGGAAKLADLKKAASEMKVKPPALNPASGEPISLSFPNPTNTRDIYKAIGQAFGINVLFDSKLRDTKISIEMKSVTARQALENVMQASGHFYKVLDEKSVIVVEDTPQNRRDYEDLVVKTFFLSNGDVKDVNNMLRALIDARRLAVNEQLNSIVIRDTADKVAIAERLIDANDKAKAEVLVDVELMQVDSTKLRDIGMSLSSNTLQFGFDPTLVPGNKLNYVPITNVDQITRSMWGVLVPNFAINLIKSAGEAETLAQPQLRITEREKGSLIIGDKVPIPTTTFNTTQTVGGNIVPITAFQYQDVGIKIDIEPKVHHNNEVTLKLKIEVSELGAQVTVATGQTQPEISTRNIDTTIRLKDGETSLLAGLFRYNESQSASGLPWLSELPVIGSLFRDTNRSVKKTDLVLTLTPHIIRNPDITEADLAPLWVGTENRITIFGNSPRVRSATGANPLGDEGVRRPGQRLGAGQPESWDPTEAPEAPPQQPQTAPGQGPGLNVSELGDGKGAATAVASAQTSPQSATSSTRASVTAADQVVTVEAEKAVAGTLAALVFYPARLSVGVGETGQIAVLLDPGSSGVTPPLHLAYDPSRLEVTKVENGVLPGSRDPLPTTPTHTPSLGWITVGWNGTATGIGTLVRLTVRPRQAGEIPLLFAGPAGAVVSTPATVVGLAASSVARAAAPETRTP
jgi:general secretion pathway protein D